MEPKKTDSGLEIKPFYTLDDWTPGKEIPGEFPYTRGIQGDMYRGKLWTMRQYAGFSTAEESNKRYHYLLSQGVTGLSVAFDLPTQIGYDSDDPIADGEVGKVGVPIDTLEDMELLFKGISLEQVTTSMTINSTAFILLSMYVALAKKGNANLHKISGTIQNDILKEYSARGTYIYPPKPSMKIITDIFEWCGKELPRWNTISISGYHIREAGSNAAQEVAFTLSNGIAYVQAALDKGLDIDVFGRRLSFFFNAHNHLLEEISKFRAARRIWAKIMKDFGAKDPKAMMLRFHTQTGGSTLTAQQPMNNISRVTIQSLAAVLGGTQSLHTNGFDEALGLPTEEAARIALRTQQIIAFESGITDVADPLAGSYLIESMTDEMEKKVHEWMSKIESMGGSIAGIENGFIQNEIAKSAYAYQQSIEKNERIIVGLNKFQSDDKTLIPHFTIDEKNQKNQIERLNSFREKRNTVFANNSLEKLRDAATTDKNIIPHVIECIESSSTLGEISNILRNVYGEMK